MHTRQDASAPEGTLRQALAWVINERIFDNLILHGNTKWLPVDLVVLALFWVWSDQPTLTAAFTQAQRWAAALFTRVAIHSYQGLTGSPGHLDQPIATLALATLPATAWNNAERNTSASAAIGLLARRRHLASARQHAIPRARTECKPSRVRKLWPQQDCQTSQAEAERASSQACRRAGKAADLDQISCCGTWACARRGVGKMAPRIPMSRDHFRQLLAEQQLPGRHAWFCADAAFVGYDLWKAIQDAGHSFLIRVGGNVTLLRGLGYVREHDGLVYCWPEKAAKKRQPPLVLRLWRIQVGRCAMSLLTNVRDEGAVVGGASTRTVPAALGD